MDNLNTILVTKDKINIKFLDYKDKTLNSKVKEFDLENKAYEKVFKGIIEKYIEETTKRF